MPIDYKTYHPKWSLISRLIRFVRANNRCEKCGVLNGSLINRGKDGAFTYAFKIQLDELHLLTTKHQYSKQQALSSLGLTKVVLTVAHIDHDKNNNRFWNLAAWCQKCHLSHDIKQHVANRKYGRDYKSNNHKLEL
jgi:hypothetical protein